MDLLDFDGKGLYFDEPLPEQVGRLLTEAARAYGGGAAEIRLLRAHALAPDSLTVLVALYRFHYYQHRPADALKVARKALEVSGARLNLPASWRQVGVYDLGRAAIQSMGIVRFYLLALKGAGYLSLRMGDMAEGIAMLGKVCELDPKNRMGAAALLELLKDDAAGTGAGFEYAGRAD
ncbi:hypothetical protein BMS3Bbin12_00277 [bacterium BMS3Bbin12]|nr:hypothetical protein BMS3Abin12_01801 [bacterium BMS3Abin12]GBE47123.1 hypothetical protein BMS3Bbin12_00277 [bacterium BMS3Bbin12]GBE51378.1 hypothetical protein BMS3Bbin13_02336 [bacterium BMS3Bbin13]